MLCRKTNNTVCPKCQHHFLPLSSWLRRGRQAMSGGRVQAPTNQPPPDPAPMLQQPQTAQAVPVLHVHHHHHLHMPAPPPPRVIHLAPPPVRPMGPPPMVHVAVAGPDLPTSDTVRDLRRSGWYYENISYEESQNLLKDKQLGTFIVRDSSDPRFLYSLSVQTERGPTSVRIHYANARFQLDAQQHMHATMPSFPTVIELVEHYMGKSQQTHTTHVWVDPKGNMYSAISITQPLVKNSQNPATLKHLARMAVNGAVKRSRTPINVVTIGQLGLPPSVSQYLTEYPYSI